MKTSKKKKSVNEETIQVGLSLNIVKGYNISDGNRQASSVLNCDEVNQMVSKLNRIYQQAGIEFSVVNCRNVKADTPRSSIYTRDIRDVEQLFNQQNLYYDGLVNVFFVPILSDDTNAYQLEDETNFIVISESDPSDWIEFSLDDLSKLLAHELGHELGVRNHNPSSSNLMYWLGPRGVVLSASQIKAMRRKASSGVYHSKTTTPRSCSEALSRTSRVRRI